MVDTQDVSAILGKNVRSATGEDMGRVVDVIVTEEGVVRAAVIDFGGFLGVGSRKVAVDWKTMRFAPDGKAGTITLAMTRNQLRSSPEYRAGEPIVILGTPPPPAAAPAAPAPVAAAPPPAAPAPAPPVTSNGAAPATDPAPAGPPPVPPAPAPAPATPPGAPPGQPSPRAP